MQPEDIWTNKSDVSDWSYELERDGKRVLHHDAFGVAQWDEPLGPSGDESAGSSSDTSPIDAEPSPPQ